MSGHIRISRGTLSDIVTIAQLSAIFNFKPKRMRKSKSKSRSKGGKTKGAR